MSSNTDARGAEPLAHHSDDVLFPSAPGNVVVYLDKEALLSWFTGVRSDTHQEVIDRPFHLGNGRAHFSTSVYQLVEVFTKVRYADAATTAAELQGKVVDSVIRVAHGSDDWNDHRQKRTPKDVFDAVAGLFEERSQIEFSFPEVAPILALARENLNRRRPIYLFTFDGTLATLADTFDVPVLPYSTPLRDDSGR